MATKTYTVKTYATAAAPRSARLRALGTGAATAAAAPSGSAGDGHGHPNKAFLDTLGDDTAATEDGAAATRRIYLDASGTAYIEYNAGTGCLVCSVPIASKGDVAAFSGGEVPDSGTGGGTGGTAYSRLDAWADYDAAKAMGIPRTGFRTVPCPTALLPTLQRFFSQCRPAESAPQRFPPQWSPPPRP